MLRLNLIDEPRKVCRKCVRRLPVSCYSKHNKAKGGLHPRCKQCRAAQDADLYRRQREERLVRAKQHYRERREEILAYQRDLYANSSRHRFEAKQAAKKSRPKWRRRRRSDPVIHLMDSVQTQIRKTLNGLGRDRRSALYERLGYRQSDLHAYLRSFLGKPCATCNSSTVLALANAEIDHIVQRNTATSREDVWQLYRLENMRMVCKTCNKTRRKRS